MKMVSNKLLPCKPHQTYRQQVEKLITRGMQVPDKQRAIKKLSVIGYYRLSGYWHVARKADPVINKFKSDNFESGSCFNEVYKLYLFDQKLRVLIFSFIERIENALKALIAYELGAVSPTAYEENIFFDLHHKDGTANYQKLQNKLQNTLKHSKEYFIKWHEKRYQKIPIWVFCDIWDFGIVSHLYTNLNYGFQKKISDRLSISRPRDLVNSLHILNIVRNRCAHNSRLWNQNTGSLTIPKSILQNIPRLNSKLIDNNLQKNLGGIILLIIAIVNTFGKSDEWLRKIIYLLQDLPNLPNVNYKSMGFTSNNINILLNLMNNNTKN